MNNIDKGNGCAEDKHAIDKAYYFDSLMTAENNEEDIQTFEET